MSAAAGDTPPSPFSELVYFEGRGRAEQARWVLAAAQEPFVNVSLQNAAQFQAVVSERCLFRQVPLLVMDGLNIVQSQAIIRHVARRANLLGATAAEQALADQVAEGCSDWRSAVLSLPFSGDTDACAAAVQRYAPVFEALLKKSPTGWVAGGEALTYADVLVAEALTSYMEALGDFSQQVTYLATHRSLVLELPGLAGYLASPQRFPFPTGDVGKAYVANVRKCMT